MVQILTTVLLTYVERPSMNDCLKVSKAVHKKFKFLGDDGSSEVCKNMTMYQLVLYVIHLEQLEMVYIHKSTKYQSTASRD